MSRNYVLLILERNASDFHVELRLEMLLFNPISWKNEPTATELWAAYDCIVTANELRIIKFENDLDIVPLKLIWVNQSTILR